MIQILDDSADSQAATNQRLSAHRCGNNTPGYCQYAWAKSWEQVRTERNVVEP